MGLTKQVPTVRPAVKTAAGRALQRPRPVAGPVSTRGNADLSRLFRAAKDDEPCPKCAAKLHRHAGPGPDPEEVPPIVYEVLRSPGRPLDENVRADMEQRFGGADFSDVRIHTDAQAMKSAEAVNARAFTVSNHIVFSSPDYLPPRDGFESILAHELVHTLQAPLRDWSPNLLAIDDSNSPEEAAARALSKQAVITPDQIGQAKDPTAIGNSIYRDVSGPTKRETCGETGRFSSFEHMLIEEDYLNNINPNAAIEYGIPHSSATGEKGYADILEFDTPSVYEIKSASDDIGEARNQLARYRYNGSLFCPGLEDLIYGVTYPSPRVIRGVLPNEQLVVELVEPGILVYSKGRRTPQPEQVPVARPADATESEREKEVKRRRLKEELEAAGVGIAVVAAVAAVVVVAPYIAAAIPEILALLTEAGVEAGAALAILQRAGLVGAR